MKKVNFTLLFLALALGNAFAQNYFNLILFSESGETFDAYVNGVKQNANPESNIKITQLNSTAVNVRVVFENKSYPQLKQNFMLENGFEHTVNIKRNMKKVWKMQYFAKTPIETATGGSNAVVIPYHTTEEPAATVNTGNMGSTTISTNTQPTGNNTSNNTGNNNTSTTGTNTTVNMNLGGINVNFQVNETQTTTSQTSSTVTSTGNAAPPKHTGTFTSMPVEATPVVNTPASTGCSGAMNAAAYERMKKSVSDKPFSDTKMSTAKVATKNACLSADQIAGICKLFSMDDDKLEYAKYAYDFCVDKKNYYQVSNVFTFSGTTDDFNEFLQNK
jgi:hypothetical protein